MNSWIFADAADVNRIGIKMILANGLSTFFIKGKTNFNNDLKSLPRNPPDCPTLCNCYFKVKQIHNTLAAPCETSKIVFFLFLQ